MVENQFVTSIPLLTRNPLLLVSMTAGAIGTTTPGSGLSAGDNTVSQNQTNFFRINGGRNRSSEILIDGASDTGTYNNQAGAIPQVDAVQEFKINTNPYDAELGHTGGGVISFTTRSGTNDFHGSLREFLQNAVLNANGFNANKAGTPRRQLQKNQFGFTSADRSPSPGSTADRTAPSISSRTKGCARTASRPLPGPCRQAPKCRATSRIPSTATAR